MNVSVSGRRPQMRLLCRAWRTVGWYATAVAIGVAIVAMAPPAFAGAVGSQFRANTYKADTQERSSVAGLSGGGFVVIWESFGQDGDGYGVYGQRYDSAGTGVDKAFRVNTTTANDQAYPSVAPLSDGGFVVVWASLGQDGQGYAVYAQLYDAAGKRIRKEFRVSTDNVTGFELMLSVAGLIDGGFVVAWESLGQDGAGYCVRAQRYDGAGKRVGKEIQVNTHTTSDQRLPSVAGLNGGGFVVVWQSDGQDGDSSGVYAQRYDSAGKRAGKEFRVNTYTTSIQGLPQVAQLNDDGFVVTWVSLGQGDDPAFSVHGQRYDSAGKRAGKEFRISGDASGNFDSLFVSGLSGGGFVVVWDSFNGSDGDGLGVYAQRYDSAGGKVGGLVRVNSTTQSDQQRPSVAGLTDGGFIVTWDGNGQGDSDGVFGQRYAP